MTFEKNKFQIKNAADLTAVGGTLSKVIARSTPPVVNYLPATNTNPKGGRVHSFTFGGIVALRRLSVKGEKP